MNSPVLHARLVTAALCAALLTPLLARAASANPHDQASAVKHVSAKPDEELAQLPTATLEQTQAALTAADALIARADLDVYRGWLKYLKFRATEDRVRMGPESTAAKSAFKALVDWTAEIAADPDLIHKLRGVHEWAYESAADGTGQPFRIAIPTDYDPARPPGVSLYCHGYSGNHLEHSAGMTAHPGRFDIAVLGRARGGWYRMLSERDVLDVLAYVKRTWRIDENRVDLSGGSMGGFASLWLGSRYPDLFACARPSCGYALATPIENMEHTPVYSLHSQDDPIVFVVGSRGPLDQLSALGGRVIKEETNGFGHAAWEWQDGQGRSSAWGAEQVRVDPATVREINYTAMDGVANGAWWAHVAEWGTKQAPARVQLVLDQANGLYGILTNIRRLRLSLKDSPVDRTRPLHFSLGTARAVTLPAPLPDVVDVVVDGALASFAAPNFPPVRPHSPGGAALVYDGSPLLIVYGTQGDALTTTALRAAATAAAKSPNPSWPVDNLANAPGDGISHYQNLYGLLPVKADVDVTPADIVGRNLIIIGTTAENALAARLAAQLPVEENKTVLATSDGFKYQTSEYAWALVHFNPLAPQRLILWIAGASKDFYQAGALLPRELFYHGTGTDFLVLNREGRVQAARSFDTDWKWSPDYAVSPALPREMATKAGWSLAQAEIVRATAQADFGLAPLERVTEGQVANSFMAEPGVTRFADFAHLQYEDRIFILEMKGVELIEFSQRLAANPGTVFSLTGNFDVKAVSPERVYTVAIDSTSVWAFNDMHFIPKAIRWTGLRLTDAIGAHATAIGSLVK